MGRSLPDPHCLPAYAGGVAPAIEEMACIAVEARACGIRQFHVKLGTDRNWQADVAGLSLVREAVSVRSLIWT